VRPEVGRKWSSEKKKNTGLTPQCAVFGRWSTREHAARLVPGPPEPARPGDRRARVWHICTSECLLDAPSRIARVDKMTLFLIELRSRSTARRETGSNSSGLSVIIITHRHQHAITRQHPNPNLLGQVLPTTIHQAHLSSYNSPQKRNKVGIKINK
jgi:hypothetical protein